MSITPILAIINGHCWLLITSWLKYGYFLPVTYYSPLVWCYAQLSFHWKSTEQKTFLKVRTCFFILSHGPCPFSVSCLKATNIYLLLSFLCRFFKRQMQFTITRYDRARDKTGLKYYVCFFALLVDSGFFEGVKRVLHVGEVGFFRFLCQWLNAFLPLVFC